MRPAVLHRLPYSLADTCDQDRHRGEEQRHAIHRALLQGAPAGPSLAVKLQAAILTRLRRDHSLADHACPLPNGSTGRVAVVQHGGEWTLLCRVAGTS